MTAEVAYGRLERLLHQIAFAGPPRAVPLQRRLAEIEESILTRRLPASSPSRPVFITALPRAGTTLLLSLLAELEVFATHTYRDMPFPLCPLLWHRISQSFRRPARQRERVHGDGVMVGYDSPEAFEEVIWMAFWREKYREDRILAWTADDRSEAFETFLARHMRKVIAVRAAERAGSGPTRYLSKNNANIARLRLLPVLYPDCRIVVPVRDPWSHAGSLLRQHRRFSQLHAKDAFARRYMAWLGHFEFGAELRPIRLSGGRRQTSAVPPEELDFWLDYWVEVHEAILATSRPQLVLLDYATLCAEPASTLEALAAALAIDESGRLVELAGRLRRPTTRADSGMAWGSPRRRRAGELYQEVRKKCVNAPVREPVG